MLDKPIELDINEETCNALQYLHYIVTSYSEIVKEILSNKRGVNANKELLDYYNELYINYSVELKILQEELVNSLYEIPKGQYAVYYIDFTKQILVITNLVSSNTEGSNEV